MALADELVPREELASALTRVTVGNRSSTTVDLEVPGGGFQAHWELIMQDYGIIMGAQLRPADGGAVVTLMEPRKFKDTAGLVSGDFAIPAAGSLEVTFDNKYSMLRSKTFDYRIEMKGTDSDAQLQQAPEPEKEQLVPGSETTEGDGEDLLPAISGSGKKLSRTQVREMVRIQMELDSPKPPTVTDEWIDHLFVEFDQNKSGTIDDAEWDSLVAALRSRVASMS
jgi:hypothetical protein